MSKAEKRQPVVAAFDFDGTITDRDTLLPFLEYTFSRCRVYWALFCSVPFFLGWAIGLVSRQGIKEQLLRHFFRGTSQQEIEQWATAFAHKYLPKFVKPEALDRIRWHQEQEHHCVLISASIETYLLPWGRKVGFHDIIASRIEVDAEGKVTGNLIGNNCRDAEKVRRLEEQLGPKSDYILYAYGNSDGDKALLAIADHSYYKTMPH